MARVALAPTLLVLVSPPTPFSQFDYIHTCIPYPGGELGLWTPSGDTPETAIEAILSGFILDAQKTSGEVR